MNLFDNKVTIDQFRFCSLYFLMRFAFLSFLLRSGRLYVLYNLSNKKYNVNHQSIFISNTEIKLIL